MRKVIVMLSACFLGSLTSCATNSPATFRIPPLGEAIVSGIQESIDAGAPARALQDIKALAADGKATEAVLDLQKSALQSLVEEFSKALEHKDYQRAIALYRTASAIDQQELLSNWNLVSLVTESVNARAEQGDLIAALFDLYSLAQDPAVTLDGVDISWLSEYFPYLYQTGDRGLADYAIYLAEQAGLKANEDLITLANRNDSPAEMLKGVVTVWVNKGIKIENGIGLPDRVIGSGFFIDSRGYILTNHHVIESEVDPEYDGYSRLFVRTSDNPEERIPAKVIAWDRVFDLALLKAEIDPAYVFSFSITGEPDPGQRIFAIGSPGGLENTITSGIVSATKRRFLQMGDAMQVDVPINPGNSGGPLLDESGRLIGVVFAGIEQFEGINFAIPSDWVIRMIPGLFKEGEYVHSWIGTALQEADDSLEVMYTVPGAPAYSAGIEVGDIITSINGVPVDDLHSAQAELMRYRPDTLIKLGVQRNNATTERYVALSRRPFSPILFALENDVEVGVLPPLFGMSVVEAGSYLWEKQYIVDRVYAGGVADESGISVNDPVSIDSFDIDEERRIALLRITIKKRKAGFIESSIQIGSYLEVDSFL